MVKRWQGLAISKTYLGTIMCPLSYLTTEHSKKVTNEESHEYNFFDAGLSAGVLTAIEPFTSEDVKKITLSDFIMGKYAGDQEIFLTYINGESMNRIMPNHSLIAIKKYDSVVDLKDGDIVAFDDAGEMCVKQFYKDYKAGLILLAQIAQIVLLHLLFTAGKMHKRLQ